MQELALRKTAVTKYTVYVPFDRESEKHAAEVKKNILSFITKVFGGATIYPAQGSTKSWGEEVTYALEILVENLQDKETRIEQLSWLILCYLDNLNSSKGKGPEETVWFTEQQVALYKLNNPDLARPVRGGDK